MNTLVGPGLAGALIGGEGAASSLTPTQVTQISNFSSASVPMASSQSLNATQDGSVFTNTGSSGTVTLTIPLGLRIGTRFTLYENVAHNFGVSTTTGETIQVSATNQTTCSCVALGSTFTIEKLTSTLWGLMCFVGSVG